MKKIVGALAVTGLMLVGVIAAPAAQAAKYTEDENQMWSMMKDWDKRTAKFGGKSTSVISGWTACDSYEEEGVFVVMDRMVRNLRDSDVPKKQKDWALLVSMTAPLTLCRDHKDAMDDYVEMLLDS